MNGNQVRRCRCGECQIRVPGMGVLWTFHPRLRKAFEQTQFGRWVSEFGDVVDA